MLPAVRQVLHDSGVRLQAQLQQALVHNARVRLNLLLARAHVARVHVDEWHGLRLGLVQDGAVEVLVVPPERATHAAELRVQSRARPARVARHQTTQAAAHHAHLHGCFVHANVLQHERQHGLVQEIQILVRAAAAGRARILRVRVLIDALICVVHADDHELRYRALHDQLVGSILDEPRGSEG